MSARFEIFRGFAPPTGSGSAVADRGRVVAWCEFDSDAEAIRRVLQENIDRQTYPATPAPAPMIVHASTERRDTAELADLVQLLDRAKRVVHGTICTAKHADLCEELSQAWARLLRR